MRKKSNQKKKSHKKLWIILAITAVIIVTAVILVIRGLNRMTRQITSAVNNTALAETGEIEVITEGVGIVETVDSKMEMIDYNVTLRKLYKQNGERAAAGEVIAEFDGIVLDDTIMALKNQLTDIDNQLSNTSKSGSTSVTSPVSGRVKRLLAEKGDSVLTIQQEHGALAEISADGKLKVTFETGADVVKGQKVQIIYGEETIDGSIRDIIRNEVTVVFDDSDQYDIDVEVKVQAEDGTELGSGTTACGRSVMITAESGTIKSVSVEHNEKVSSGSTVFKLKDVEYSGDYLTLLEQREELNDKIKDAEKYKKGYMVVAEQDCIVSELAVKEGDTVPAGSLLCKLLDTAAYQVVLNIDELDIRGIEEEQPVEVTVDAIPDTVYQGKVSGVSLTGENVNGAASYRVSVSLAETQDLLPGMSADGKITIENKSGVLLIPLDTIKTIEGEKTVTVVKADGTTENRKVTLGLVNNENAEVLDGVTEGEELQIIVKLQDINSQMGIMME